MIWFYVKMCVVKNKVPLSPIRTFHLADMHKTAPRRPGFNIRAAEILVERLYQSEPGHHAEPVCLLELYWSLTHRPEQGGKQKLIFQVFVWITGFYGTTRSQLLFMTYYGSSLRSVEKPSNHYPVGQPAGLIYNHDCSDWMRYIPKSLRVYRWTPWVRS